MLGTRVGLLTRDAIIFGDDIYLTSVVIPFFNINFLSRQLRVSSLIMIIDTRLENHFIFPTQGIVSLEVGQTSSISGLVYD